MNKKDKFSYLMLFFLIQFVFIGNVFAADLNFMITAVADNVNVLPGNMVKVKVKLKSNNNIYGCTFRTEYSSTLVELSGQAINNWETGFEGVGGTTESYVITNKDITADLSSGVEILELSYKVNGDGKLSIITDSCVDFVSETSKSHERVDIDFKVLVEPSVTTLSSITVKNGSVIDFSPNNLEPNIVLNNNTFGLAFVTTNSDFQNSVVLTDVNGNKINDFNNITFKKDSGSDTMTLFATVNNDTKYKLKIKHENKILNNSISLLKVGNKKVNLVDGIYNYVVNVGSDVKSIDIVTELVDNGNFQFLSTNAPGVYSLNEKKSIIKLIVEPKDKSSNAKSLTYVLEIIKDDVVDNSNDENVADNPQTGSIFVFLMIVLLISSLIGCFFIYKNMNKLGNLK